MENDCVMTKKSVEVSRVTRQFLSNSCLVVLLIYLSGLSVQANDNVIFNKPVSANDARYQYTYDLMQLVLDATKQEFGEGTITFSENTMTRGRIFNELKKGKLINVMAEAPKKHWDKSLLAVPIPIRKGIQGFRVFIIKDKYQQAFKKINSFADLAKYSTGSGRLWSTVTAMEAAGLNVVTGAHYDGLFGMLEKERFISFGRGINEAYKEVATYKARYGDLMVDTHVLLHIPLVTFFYVSPKFPKLANRIEKGLEKIIADGSFDRFFYQRHCRYFKESSIDKRKVFTIENPLISEELWQELSDKNYLLAPEMNVEQQCLQ